MILVYFRFTFGGPKVWFRPKPKVHQKSNFGWNRNRNFGQPLKYRALFRELQKVKFMSIYVQLLVHNPATTLMQWMGAFLNGDFELRHAIPYLMTPFFRTFKGAVQHGGISSSSLAWSQCIELRAVVAESGRSQYWHLQNAICQLQSVSFLLPN